MAQIWKIGSSPGIPKEDFLPVALEKNFSAVGWAYLGNLTQYTRESLKSALKEQGDTELRVISRKANEIINFRDEIRRGDIILQYDSKSVYAGIVTKPYYFVEKGTDEDFFKETEDRVPNRVGVDWLFNKKSLKVDFSKWRDTVHKVENEDLIGIEIDQNLRDYLLTNSGSTMKKQNFKVDKTNEFLDLLNKKKQVILYGPPGTGKTYNSKYIAVEFLRRDENVK